MKQARNHGGAFEENRRQKVVNKGLYVCAEGIYVRAGGLDIQIWQEFH